MAVPQIDKRLLSGSTDGQPIAVAATSSPGTLVHTAQSGTTPGSYDEVWMWAVNTGAAAVTLTVQFGGVGTGDAIDVDLPANSGPVLVVPGIPLQNSKVVRAFGSTTGINIVGYVNRMTA